MKLSGYLLYFLLIVFYIFLTAYVLWFTTAAFFPAAVYWDYLLPAFGILFVVAGGHDLSKIKTVLQRQGKDK